MFLNFIMKIQYKYLIPSKNYLKLLLMHLEYILHVEFFLNLVSFTSVIHFIKLAYNGLCELSL